LIIRLNYFRDNSVIFPESSYWRGGLRSAAESRTVPSYLLSNCCSITLLLLGAPPCVPLSAVVLISVGRNALLRQLRPTWIKKCTPPPRKMIRERTSRSHNRDPEYCLLSEKRNSARKTHISYCYTGSSKKMDGISNRYNLKNTGRIYTFGILKCSEKFKVLDLP
jgi:hypothetical protein